MAAIWSRSPCANTGAGAVYLLEATLVITVPADALAFNGTCPSADTVITKQLDMFSSIYFRLSWFPDASRCPDGSIQNYRPETTTARGMMTSSNGNIFRVTGHLCGEFTGPGECPLKGQWRGALMFSLICTWINGWVNNREAGDLRRRSAYYDVIVM